MELFFPKINKISEIDGPSNLFISINLVGLPKIGNFIFLSFKKFDITD